MLQAESRNVKHSFSTSFAKRVLKVERHSENLKKNPEENFSFQSKTESSKNPADSLK